MKQLFLMLFAACSLHLTAQLETPNNKAVTILENDPTQHIEIVVSNISDNAIDFDWQIEYLNETEEFITISISDINFDYTPDIISTCDIEFATNVVEAMDSASVFVHFSLDDIPTDFDKTSVLGYFNLYEDGNCFVDTLVSLPIMFEQTSKTQNIQVFSLGTIFPNPTNQYLFFDTSTIASGTMIEIYDILGNKLKQEKVNDIKINVGDLNAGSYLLKTQHKIHRFIKSN